MATIAGAIGAGAGSPVSAAVSTANATRLNLVVNGIVYDPVRDVIYASVDDTDTTYPNKLVTVDPETRTVTASYSVGTQPASLAISADGTALFVGVDGQGAVTKLALPSMTQQWSYTFGTYFASYVMLAGDIEVLPGSNDSIVVSRRVSGLSPSLAGIVVVDGGVARPTAGPGHIGSNTLAFDPDGTRLYGADTETSPTSFYVNSIDATGVSGRTQHGIGGGGEIVYHDGRVYAARGQILDVTGASPVLSDTITGGTSVVVDAASNRIFYTAQGTAGTLTTKIVAYDLTTLEPVGDWAVSVHVGFSDRLIATGTDRLAYIDSGHPVALQGRLVLVDIGAAEPPPPPPPTTAAHRPPPPLPDPATSAYGEYTPLTPVRILDTRSGLGRSGAAPVGPGATLDVMVAGVGGVPASGVSAVVMNVTAVLPTELGYLTIFPTGLPRPTISNLNFEPGTVVANLVTMPVGSGGRVSAYNPFGATDVLFDVAGYYAADGGTQGLRFHPLAPTRFMDTRDGTGGRLAALGPADSAMLQIGGRLGVPSDARSVALNVTVTGTTAPSFVSIYPSDVARPLVSNINVGPGSTIANQAIVRLPATGVLAVYNEAGVGDVIVDVVGYYDQVESGDRGRFVPTTPSRVIDTRLDSPFPAPGNLPSGAVLYTPDTVSISAYVLNVTATSTTGYGYVTVYPYVPGGRPPLASNLNYSPGRTVPNHVIAPAGPAVAFYNAGGTTHLVVDLFGHFT